MNQKFIPYLLSLSRVITGICIFFTPVESYLFDLFFLLNGVADVLGERFFVLNSIKYSMDKALNSLGTVLFITAGSIKLIPSLFLTSILYAWLFFIAFLIIWNLLSEYFIYGHAIYVDSIAIRAVKFMLYLFPILIRMIKREFILILIFAISTFAEIQVGHLVRMKTTEREILGLKSK